MTPRRSGVILVGMTKTVDFYFDYLSPFAYLASLEAPELCTRRGARLHFRPVLFAGLLDHFGQRGPAEIPPKAIHALRATLRYARSRGIPLRSPRFHPFKPLVALRATLAAESDEDRARAVRALFAHGWVDGGDLGSAAEISLALSAAGLDGVALVERASEDALKRRLKEETELAIARGVFGIPTLFVDEQLYWGLDQLEYVASHLDGEDPLAGVDLASLAPQGASAVRPAAR
jgi:2-hydroxychromene-2-carboxylate isomerase